MGNIGETPGGKTVRLGIEATIKDYYLAGDMTKVNECLDVYPHNIERPTPSLEAVRHMRKVAMRNAGQQTEEIPIVTPEILEDAA